MIRYQCQQWLHCHHHHHHHHHSSAPVMHCSIAVMKAASTTAPPTPLYANSSQLYLASLPRLSLYLCLYSSVSTVLWNVYITRDSAVTVKLHVVTTVKWLTALMKPISELRKPSPWRPGWRACYVFACVVICHFPWPCVCQLKLPRDEHAIKRQPDRWQLTSYQPSPAVIACCARQFVCTWPVFRHT